jgi:hypothetical protein
LVELQPSKLDVASSNLVSRSKRKFIWVNFFAVPAWSCYRFSAHVAQSVERFLGKEEVHRFDSGRGLQPQTCHFKVRLHRAAVDGFKYITRASKLINSKTMGG